jgi:glutaredoxin
MKMKIKSVYLIAIIIVSLAVITLTGLAATGYFSMPSGKYDNFAKCLSQKNAVMYGAEWCGHCKNQKAMFGDSFKYVTYVECTTNQATCDANGVQGYPTWIINGKAYPGEISLESLSTTSGCPLQ